MSAIMTYAKFISTTIKNNRYSPLIEYSSDGWNEKNHIVLPSGSINHEGKIVSNDTTKAHGLLPGSKVSTGTGDRVDPNMHTLIKRHGFEKGVHSVIMQSRNVEKLHEIADKLNK